MEVRKFSEDVFETVTSRIETLRQGGAVDLPKDYSAENALRGAWLILQETKNSSKVPVLDACTKESIANALLKMVILGLNPYKKQCNFIAYGKTLSCDTEYAGSIALAKRYGGLKSIKANAIFKDDEFEFEVDPSTGKKTIKKHKQKLESLGSKELRGAYAICTLEDGSIDTEIMSMPQIRQSWMQGQAKGNSHAHINFPDQMAIKTVINRACKLLIRSSDDAPLFDGDQIRDQAQETVDETIKANANKNTIKMDDDEPKQPEQISEKVEAKEIDLDNVEDVEYEEAAQVQPKQQQTAGPGF